jgi:hypothetical protein
MALGRSPGINAGFTRQTRLGRRSASGSFSYGVSCERIKGFVADSIREDWVAADVMARLTVITDAEPEHCREAVESA